MFSLRRVVVARRSLFPPLGKSTGRRILKSLRPQYSGEALGGLRMGEALGRFCQEELRLLRDDATQNGMPRRGGTYTEFDGHGGATTYIRSYDDLFHRSSERFEKLASWPEAAAQPSRDRSMTIWALSLAFVEDARIVEVQPARFPLAPHLHLVSTPRASNPKQACLRFG